MQDGHSITNKDFNQMLMCLYADLIFIFSYICHMDI